MTAPPSRPDDSPDPATTPSATDETLVSDRSVRSRGPGPGPVPGRIGDYPVKGSLGQGGMGAVYLAEDPKLRRQVAIKVLPPQVARDRDWIERFESEAQLLASINHPNIATIYSLEEHEGSKFLTLELIDGPDLREKLAEGPLPLDEALEIARAVAIALEAAHGRGVVHLDIKPGNIKLTERGSVKVLDFGLARIVEEGVAPGRTGTASRKPTGGTPGYMSPEQIRGGTIDSRADVWGFGCVLFECLAGEPAFIGSSVTELLDTTLGAEPTWAALPQLPESIETLVRNCLRVDLAARVPNMADVRRCLDQEIEIRKLRTLTRPTLREADEVPNNLPHPRFPLLARERELAAGADAIRTHPLLTLVGAGGCGKTRLSNELARLSLADHPDGVWWIDLAAVREPELFTSEIAKRLGVRERRGVPLATAILDELRSKRVLLVLDSCERLDESCRPILERLIDGAPDLRVVATSRKPFALPREIVQRIPPLDVPASSRRGGEQNPEEILSTGSVQLLVSRAQLANPSFQVDPEDLDAVVEICTRLDGIPLALELAAARLQSLSIRDLASRLDRRFRLLKSKQVGQDHHQTLRALIGWSYEQLEEDEQALFRRLAVFVGGFTLDAAESVCAGGEIESEDILELVSQLVDQSLIEVDTARGQGLGLTRYRMLETVRHYGRELLETDPLFPTLQSAHLDFVSSLVEEAQPNFTGPEADRWLKRIDAEIDNIRAALQVALEPGRPIGLAAKTLTRLWQFWLVRGLWSEGLAHYEAILEQGKEALAPKERARMQHHAGNLLWNQGSLDRARELFEEAATDCRARGDHETLGGVLNGLGTVAMAQGDLARARTCGEESLAIGREQGIPRGIAISLSNLGAVALHEGSYDEAERLIEESLELRRELGERRAVAVSLCNLSLVHNGRNEPEKAIPCLEESLRISRELGDQGQVASTCSNLGNVYMGMRETALARKHLMESLHVYSAIGNQRGIAFTLSSLGLLESAEGAGRRAVTLLSAADRLWEDMGAQLSPGGQQQVAAEQEKLRSELGDLEFEDAKALGKRLSGAEAVEFARKE